MLLSVVVIFAGNVIKGSVISTMNVWFSVSSSSVTVLYQCKPSESSLWLMKRFHVSPSYARFP